MRRARIIPVLVVIVTLPLALAQEPAQEEAAQSDASRCHPIDLPGMGPACLRADGLYEVFARDGRSLGFTHGPDPACPDCEAARSEVGVAGSTAVQCMDGHPGEYHVRVIYARATNDVDQYAALAPLIRDMVGQANAMVDDAALATGDRLAIRVLCSGGAVVVENAVLPTLQASASWSTIIEDLMDLGYDDPHKKYWVFYDDPGACTCAGIGHFYNDDTDGPENLNNGNGIPMFAISFGNTDVTTMLHELGHNMGAVVSGAPRSSGAAHCTDGRDTMCYDDGGPNSGDCQPDFWCSGVCSVEVFDCNKDTYCHANPPAGSWLETHWQVCHRDNRFLRFAGDVPPIVTTLACTPSPSYEEESVTCTFGATDDEPVHFQIDWGDGLTARVPASGTVPAGPLQSAARAYLTAGSWEVRVRATDSSAAGLTSHDAVITHVVHPANVAPVALITGCSPSPPTEGEPVTCSFRADDLQRVSYDVSWGDGSPTVRVPASGDVDPAYTQRVTHTFARGGAFPFTVTATDTGRPVLSGSASLTLDVVEVNTAPVMQALVCSPTTLRPGDTLTCSLRADDDTDLTYRIDWGDGTSSTVPASGCVAPGVTTSATHVYSIEGDLTLAARAIDCFSPPATSGAFMRNVQVYADLVPPTVAIIEPQNGVIYFGCSDQMSKQTGRPLFVERGCVRATATDASGVARVEVWRGGTLLAVDAEAPYEMEFDVPRFAQGTGYTVRAIDTGGNVGAASFSADALGGSG